MGGGGGNSDFCRLNFENIKIIVYIFLKISKFGGGGGHTCLRQWIDVRSTIDRSVCLRRKVIDEEMCALIYLLYERLRGEILKKREQK